MEKMNESEIRIICNMCLKNEYNQNREIHIKNCQNCLIDNRETLLQTIKELIVNDKNKNFLKGLKNE